MQQTNDRSIYHHLGSVKGQQQPVCWVLGATIFTNRTPLVKCEELRFRHYILQESVACPAAEILLSAPIARCLSQSSHRLPTNKCQTPRKTRCERFPFVYQAARERNSNTIYAKTAHRLAPKKVPQIAIGTELSALVARLSTGAEPKVGVTRPKPRQ